MGLEEDIVSARLDIAELKGLHDEAKRAKVQSVLSVELRRLETHLANLLEKQEQAASQTTQAPKPVSTTAPTSKAYDVSIKNYSWDQSDKFVKFYLTNLSGVKEVANEDFNLDVTETSVKFKVCNLKGKNQVFEIVQLAHKVNPTKSHYKVKSEMVTILLSKESEGFKWSHATAASKAQADKKTAASAKVDTDVSKDPSAGLMDMMKKMYDEGDDDMKKTIAKAWTESRDKKGGPPGMGLPDL